MGHTFTWTKLAQNAYRLNPKSRGFNYPYVPKFETEFFSSGPNTGKPAIIPYKGTNSLLIGLRAWGVTQSSLHKVSLLFHDVEILTKNPNNNSSYFQMEYDDKMYWIKKLDKNRNPLTSRCSCFTGDTLIKLANDKLAQLKSLVGGSFAVKTYSQNGFRGAEAGNCSIKQENALIIKLTFEDGSTVRCTPDHKFLIMDNQWEEAKNLLNKYILTDRQEKYLKCVSIEDAGYEDVYCITVPQTANFVLENGCVVHNCADFFFTFAWYNYDAGCLYGTRPKPYQRKTNWAKPRNPKHIIAVCKHIYHSWQILKDSGFTVN